MLKHLLVLSILSSFLYAKNCPKLYELFCKPLSKANKIFSNTYFDRDFGQQVELYHENSMEIFDEARALELENKLQQESKKYLSQLRTLQRQHDDILRSMRLRLLKAIKEEDDANFEKLIKYSEGQVLNDSRVYFKCVNYFLAHSTRLDTPLLETRIKEDESYTKRYAPHQENRGNKAQKSDRNEKRYGHYVDMGDYIKDLKTGLLWQKYSTSSGKLNFYQAKEYAKNLEIDGLKGWRVPTRAELNSIFPATQKLFEDIVYTEQKCCDGDYEWDSYWTSERDFRLDDYAFLYQWYHKGGANNCYASKNYAYVRCVRGRFRKGN